MREASFEKRYEMKDRLAHGLFTALCRSLNVGAYTLTKSSTAPIYVRADAPTHARLQARWAELLPLYDDHVLAAGGSSSASAAGWRCRRLRDGNDWPVCRRSESGGSSLR
ncbi:MAG: hypothetical protein U0324_02935 [Polyangiales bacterium]